MTDNEALVGLNMAADIGSVKLSRLLEFFERPAKIFEAPADKLTAVSGIGHATASRIRSFDTRLLDEEFSLAKKAGVDIITFQDPGYPGNLNKIPGPPIVLYVKGSFLKSDELSLAIVGSRQASFYGMSMAAEFAARMSGLGFTIVSGMARGVDTYAHKGALKASGRTIAVIGSGFMNIYPEENRELSQEISRSGAVISEFAMNTLPLPRNFPRRNRLISGLSLGTLVTEARRNSGALITADFALEQGREVFALPGKVDCALSLGTNGLIKQGAKLVSCVEDIIEELQVDVGLVRSEPAKNRLNKQEDESLLLEYISREPKHIDEIARDSRMGRPEVMESLLRLEIKKLIKQMPGKQFIRD